MQATTDTEITTHVLAMKRFAVSLTGNMVDAEDLVQESLTRVMAHRSRYEAIDNLRSYLFRVVRNAHIDAAKQAGGRSHTVPLDNVEDSLQAAPSQNHHMEMVELGAALARLPADQRRILMLVGCEGASYREASAALDIPIGTVMSRLSRARETLRSHLRRENGQHRKIPRPV